VEQNIYERGVGNEGRGGLSFRGGWCGHCGAIVEGQGQSLHEKDSNMEKSRRTRNGGRC